MAKNQQEESEEEQMVDLEDEEDMEPVMSENAVIDVAFGAPEDGPVEGERVMDWVASFPPGEFQRQVADLFLSDGEIYIMMDKLTVVVPMMELFRLLEMAGTNSAQDEE